MPDLVIIGVYGIVFGAVPAFVFCLAGWLGAWRRPTTAIVASVLTVITLATIVCELPDPEISSVRIDEEAQPQVLSGVWQTITGSVTPPEARVVVLVHWAHDTKWWVQDTVRRGNLGAWQAEINLGTKEKGAQQHFQIVAIASTNPWFVDVLKGYWLWDGDAVSRPPALPRSEVVSIWRSR